MFYKKKVAVSQRCMDFLVRNNRTFQDICILCITFEKYGYLCYYVGMNTTTERPIIRASEETRRLLKVIAALTNESMKAVLARLVREEYERIQKESVVK